MKVLIIGNGFDVANGLPTKYSQFLSLCKAVASCGHIYDVSQIRLCDINDNNKELLTSFYNKLGKDLYNEFVNLAANNLFIIHFSQKENLIGDKWLNFEEEIQHFIETVISEKDSEPNEQFKSTKIKALREYTNAIKFSSKSYKDLFEIIREQHKNLIRLIEIYMDGYVNRLEPTKLACFKKGFYDHVLSFNYTDTYGEKYEPELGCCYIHGKATIDKDKHCQMVLGFDNKNKYPYITEIEMLPYVKFFQRLDFKTSVDYMDWLYRMDIEEHSLIDIYGHSLAFSDADIIAGFIKKSRTKTRIFFYDELDRYDKLRNLTLILGTIDTINMVSGKNRCIELIPTDMYSTRIEF